MDLPSHDPIPSLSNSSLGADEGDGHSNGNDIDATGSEAMMMTMLAL